MICSQCRLQIVLLWLLGCCIGSLIKDKPTSYGLAAESPFIPDTPDYQQDPHLHHHHQSHQHTRQYIHSPGKRRDGIHSVSSSSSSALSSSTNSIFSPTSGGSIAGPVSHHVLHNNQQHPHRHKNGEEFAEFEVLEEERMFGGNGGNEDPGEFQQQNILDAVHEPLRSSKPGSGGSSSSGTVGSSSGGGGGSSGSAVVGGSSTGFDHHSHFHQQQQQPNEYGNSLGNSDGTGLPEFASGSGEEEEKLRNHLSHQPPREQQEKLLLQQLMRGYERDVRPVRNASQPVVVKVGITLTQIFDMDEKNQVLTTNVWFDQEWFDELLQWDPKDFSGLEVIRIPCERIWLPDIVLYNNADDYTRGYMPSRAMVQYDGNVFWPPPTKFRSTCAVDVTYFPFDDQTCTLKLGSWTYNGYQVDVTNRTEFIDLKNYVPNGEWDLLRADIKRNVEYYDCCVEPFPDVTITLVIRRKTLYYIYNIVLPCMMLSALTLLVFCLPPDSGEKIALGITVLLAFSVFMLAISEALPETSESIPLIGIYLTAVMAITSISVIVTVVVLNLHYLGPRVRPVPAWLKCLLPQDDVNFIRQKSMLIPANHREPRSGSLKRGHVYIPHSRQTGGNSAYCGDTATTVTGGVEDVIRECSSTESVTNEKVIVPNNPPAYNDAMDFATSKEKETLQQRFRKRGRHRTPTGGAAIPTSTHNNTVSSMSSTAPGSGGSASTTMAAAAIAAAAARRGGNNSGGGDNFFPNNEGGGGGGVSSSMDNKDSMSMCEDLVSAVRYLMSIQEQVESQNVLVAEWRLVAQAVDRILFWIFAMMTIISSTVLLLIFPLYKRSTYYGPPTFPEAVATAAEDVIAEINGTADALV